MPKVLKACLLLYLLLCPAKAPAAVMVESLPNGSALQEAGLQPGDVLFRWKQTTDLAPQQLGPGITGEIDSFFQWMYLVVEVAPRGMIQLTIHRSQEIIQASVAPGAWAADVRPILPENLDEELRNAERLARIGRPREALAIVSSITDLKPDIRTWILLRISSSLKPDNFLPAIQEIQSAAINQASPIFSRVMVLQEIGSHYEVMNDSLKANRAYRSAISESKLLGEESLSHASSLYQLGRFLAERGNLKEAKEYLENAAGIQRKQAPRSKAMVDTLTRLGACARETSELDRAEALYKEAITIHSTLSPTGIGLARLLSNLAGVAKDRGNLEEARRLLSEALEIAEKEPSQRLAYAGILGNLSNIAFNQGDLDEARKYLDRAQSLLEAAAPNTLMLATMLEGKAVIAQSSGDLDTAEDLNLKALRLRQRLAPDSLAVANSLNLRGVIARSRSRNDIARDSYLEALSIQEKVDPDGLELATTLNNLGSLYLDSNDFDTAKAYYQKALKIQNRLAPNSLAAARSLTNLGVVERHKGQRRQAEKFFRTALGLQERAASRGLESAGTLRRLADLALENGDLREAKRLCEIALAIVQQLAPGSREESRIRLLLAKAAVRSGEPETADRHFTQAIYALESQIGRLGGSANDRAEFRANQGELYGRAIEFYIDRNELEKAFYVLEGSRSRSFLEMLSSRDLLPSGASPELQSARQRIARRYEAVQAQLARSDLRNNTTSVEALQRELQKLRIEYEDTSEQILRSHPELGAIQSPQTMGAREIFTNLYSGTVILSYLINSTRSFLFILDIEGRLRVIELSTGGHDALQDKVERFREAIRQSAVRGHSEAMRSLVSSLSSELYSMLVLPAKSELQVGQRVLIIPEGPLYFLPWGALLETGSGQNRYFGEWKPLHLAQSATLYAQMRRIHSASTISSRPESMELIAFGDPSFPPDLTNAEPANLHDVRIRSAMERGLSFEHLPASRLEVSRISSFFKTSSLFLGQEASEENAKSMSRNTNIVHFATHTHLDERFPLDSALILTIPKDFTQGGENGLLQAWEIFERVRVNADLVVLSACESALGKELGGEGLIGLTRAFQYAGARSVLASLWKVSDRTTAELMVRFYKHLKAGKTKDEALRAAQIELIRGPIEITNEKGEVELFDASAPYYWAAFQLYGDWQ